MPGPGQRALGGKTAMAFNESPLEERLAISRNFYGGAYGEEPPAPAPTPEPASAAAPPEAAASPAMQALLGPTPDAGAGWNEKGQSALSPGLGRREPSRRSLVPLTLGMY